MGSIDESFPSAYNSSDGSEHEGAAENFLRIETPMTSYSKDSSGKSDQPSKKQDRYGEDNEYARSRSPK